LGAVLLIGLALRLWSVDFGLPFVYHVDEPFEVYRALRLGAGSFDFERIAKSGYYLLLFVEYGVYFAWLLATGAVKGAQDFSLAIVRDPSPLWLIGRVTTAVIGTLNVWVVYLLGRRLRDGATGLAAAGLLAVTYLHVAHSHYITVDLPLTCLVTVALYQALGVLQDGRRSDYVKLAVFSGLAAATKLPGILILVPALLAHGLRVRSTGGRIASRSSLRTLAGMLALMAAIYVLINPGILWQAGKILQKVFWTFSGTGTGSEVPVNTRGAFAPPWWRGWAGRSSPAGSSAWSTPPCGGVPRDGYSPDSSRRSTSRWRWPGTRT
jgi:4-amino-4-deoxy-L-arabinose transferase-like glycosyltransferase